MPGGAFYLFCSSPIEDDVMFVKHLLRYNILAVPGSGFGGPGNFRLAYCVPEDVITRSLPKFEEALGKLEDIVKKMESGDMTLEESLKAFEEGIKLARLCSRKLDEAERRVEILLKQEEGLVVKPLQVEENETEL